MNHSHRRIAIWVWAITLIGVIVGELLPGNSAIMQAIAATHISDKVLHFGAYCLLTLVPAAVFRRSNAIACLLGLVLMGGVLELLQQMVPGRSCDIWDEIANTAGVAGCTVIVYCCRLAARVVA